MKTNFSNQTASGHISLSFAQMAALEDLINTGLLESIEVGDASKTVALCEIGDSLGIDIIDIDELAESSDAGNGVREDMPVPAGQASAETGSEAA